MRQGSRQRTGTERVKNCGAKFESLFTELFVFVVNFHVSGYKCFC